ncbi:MAG: hypothetical protein IIA85_00050 [Nanoarchaeota archaeon]|nr:hypothetical protein [Nanoarchaeota archaeon]
MKKEIRVKLNDFRGESLKDDFLPIRVLKDNFNMKIVKSMRKSNIIIGTIDRSSKYNLLKENKNKYILISGEDLFIKRNIFNLIESFFHKIFKDKKYKIMDKIDSIIPKFILQLPIFYFFPRYVKFIERVRNGKIKNGYGIIQNDIRCKKIFIIPYFLNLFYYKMPELIKKHSYGLKNKKKFCAFVVSSNSSRERIDFFKKLSKYKKVDSYGKVLNNMGDKIFKTSWHYTHSQIFRDYKFIICFENNFTKEYITEKLPNAMFSGSIPIYRGAPNVGDYFNTKSFINYDDYGSYDKMIEKIIELDQDDNKYLEFSKQPWFKNNKIPEIIKTKEKDLIEFYKKVFRGI